MRCPQCNLTASRASAKVVDGYMEQVIVCTNSRCVLYSGKDLNNPQAVVEVLKTKVGGEEI
jgi:hypothetical protein